jgi:hypothetical protein
MTKYSVTFKKSVAKDLRSIPNQDVKRILSRIDHQSGQSGASDQCLRKYLRTEIHPTNNSSRLAISTLTSLLTQTLTGCAPAVGSEKWCSNLEENPTGDWSLNEATDYAANCVLR